MKIDSRDDLLVCRRSEILPLMEYDETSHKYHINKEMAGYFELLYGPLEIENVVMIFDCRSYLSRFFRGMAREFWPHEELISDNLDQIFDGYEELRGKLDKLADYQHCLANLMPAPAGFAQSRLFDGKLISCDVHTVKPCQRIYHLFTEKFSLNPEECVFIDDSPANVAGAAACGWRVLRS